MVMAKKIRTVLLFGAPGCGKGTQGKLLGTLPGFFHLACGEVFRSLDLQSEVGQVFLKYSSRGDLVPDDVTVQLWKNHFDKLVATGAFKPDSDTLVLDGIPRNIAQAKMLNQYLKVVQILALSANRHVEEIVRRLKSRALKDNRLDDANEETIRHRLEVYETESAPLIDWYPHKLRVDIDALQSPLAVSRDVICGLLGCRVGPDAVCQTHTAVRSRLRPRPQVAVPA
jgi:adenylate kinase